MKAKHVVNALWIVGSGVFAWFAYKFITGTVTMDPKTGAFDFNSDATRETRAKNLLGVSKSGTYDWQNVDLTYPGRANIHDPQDIPEPGVDNELGDHLLYFQTTQDGLNAAAWLLADNTNYFGRGDNRLVNIANHWSGDPTQFSNPSGISDYAVLVGKMMKRNPLDGLHFATDGANLMQALARSENGTPAVINVPPEMYQKAIEYAVTP